MANMEKLQSTLRYIRTHMDLWAQDTWFKPISDEFTMDQVVDMILEDPYEPACGVTGCMAGLAAFQNGYVPIFKVYQPEEDKDSWLGAAAYVNPGEMVALRDPVTGKVDVTNQLTTKEAARKVFDIDFETAGRLFDGDNTYETLQAMVAHIGEHGNLSSFVGEDEDEDEDEDYRCGDPDCSACYPEQDEDEVDSEVYNW